MSSFIHSFLATAKKTKGPLSFDCVSGPESFGVPLVQLKHPRRRAARVVVVMMALSQLEHVFTIATGGGEVKHYWEQDKKGWAFKEHKTAELQRLAA